MERTLNRAFLRAFAKENGSSPVPVPHGPFESGERKEAGDERRTQERRAATGAAPGGLLRLETPAADVGGSAASAVPSPHVAFPLSQSVDVSTGEDWLMSDVSLVEAFFSGAEIMVGPTLGGSPLTHSAVKLPQMPTRPEAGRVAVRAEPSASRAAITLAEHHGDQLAPQEVPAEEEATETAAPQPDAFAAAWEVDRLAWPQECEQLYQQLGTAFAEAGAQLRAATLDGLRVLAITSAFRGEGRTTLSMLLARAAARSGVRAAIVDADFENPQLARQLKLQLELDWRSHVRQAAPLDETGVLSLEDGLVVFPLNRDARDDVDSVSDEDLRQLWQTLAARFELVLVDWGPLEGPRRGLPADAVNAVMVVRDIRTTDSQLTQRIVRQLWGTHVEAVGIVENYVRDAA